MTTRLWLIRHGEPAEEYRGRCYGSLDAGLSETGRLQVSRIAAYLAGEPLSAIYCSPRRRAADSANILAAGFECPIETIADLREIDFGDFEGLSYDEIATRYPDLYRQWMESPAEVRFPNGECEAQVRERVLRAFANICRDRAGQIAAVVTHSGVIRILIADILQMPPSALFHLSQSYGAVNLVSIRDGYACLDLLNHCTC